MDTDGRPVKPLTGEANGGAAPTNAQAIKSAWEALADLVEAIPVFGKVLAKVLRNADLRRWFWPTLLVAVLLVLVYPFVVLLSLTTLMQSPYMPTNVHDRLAEDVRRAFGTDGVKDELDYYHVIDFQKPLAQMTPIRLRARPNQPIKIRPLQALVTSTTSDCTLPTETVIRNEALLEVRINNRTVLPLMVSAGPQDSFEVTPEQWKQFSPSLSKTDDLQITIAPARTLNESSRRLIECEGIKADVTLAIDVFRSPSFHLSSATTGN